MCMCIISKSTFLMIILIFTKFVSMVGTCYNVSLPCNDTARYADVSSCISYFECVDGDLERKECRANPPAHQVFDIVLLDCRDPDSNFDCTYRCLVMTTTSPNTTAKTTDTSDTAPEESSTTDYLSTV